MNNIVNWKSRRKLDNTCGGILHKIFSVKKSGLNNVEIAMCIFSPGEIADLHYHKEIEEIYYILEGEGEIELDGKWYPVKTEDSIAIPIGITHRMKNISTTNQLKFLSVNAPGWQDNDMVVLSDVS